MHKYMCYSLVVCAKYVHIVQYVICYLYNVLVLSPLSLIEEGQNFFKGVNTHLYA